MEILDNLVTILDIVKHLNLNLDFVLPFLFSTIYRKYTTKPNKSNKKTHGKITVQKRKSKK